MGTLATILRRSAGLPERRTDLSIGDPALAEFLGISSRSTAGQNVTESSALGLTAFYRAVSLIAGTLAALPWRTYRTTAEDTRERTTSWLDDPGAVAGLSPFAWRELLLTHVAMWGNWYGVHVYGGAGQILGMVPAHPARVSIEVDPKTGERTYRVRLVDGSERTFSALDLTHVMGLSVDGVRGVSPLTVGRNAIGSGLAGDEAAARMFENGALIAGLVTMEDQGSDPDDDGAEAKAIAAKLNDKLTGAKNAGRLAFVNRALKFQPWTQTAEDAQFIESRAFQVEEISRFYGLPKVLLSADGASTWGSGIAELIRGLERFTFRPYAARIEAPLSARLPARSFLEIDFAGLLAPSEVEATENMLAEVAAGTMTIDEFRRLKNRAPLANPAPVAAPEQEV